MNKVAKFINVYRYLRAGGFAAARRYLSELDYNHVHLLSVAPPIVYLWWGRDDSLLHRRLAGRELTLLYLFPWCYSSADLPAIKSYVHKILARFPKHNIIFLCNEEYAARELKSARLNAEFIHQNAFINENVFTLRPSVVRTHDAVYSASLAPYKRHHLASSIESLIMMSYSYGGTSNQEYSELVRQQLAHAWWAKDSVSPGQKLSVDQLVDIYARAHVGLCLSAVEGGMFVSMEYLLCGLPVVSTQSAGGRAAFWDDRYVIVCEDSSESVAMAVSELKRRSIAPEDVRRWTLEKVQPHRDRLRLLLQSLGAELKCPWPPGTHGITSFTHLGELADAIIACKSV